MNQLQEYDIRTLLNTIYNTHVFRIKMISNDWDDNNNKRPDQEIELIGTGYDAINKIDDLMQELGTSPVNYYYKLTIGIG